MILKTYQKYIIKQFSYITLQVCLIFFSLVFILNIFEEINYLKESNAGFYYPLLLTFLNTPSVFFQIFPFIFLISTQFLFIKISDQNELPLIKINGISNLKVISILILTTFFFCFSSFVVSVSFFWFSGFF